MNSSAAGAVPRALHDRDLVPDRRLRALRQRDRDQPRRCGADVGRVDEAGIGLAERELADDPLHVRLLADRLAEHAQELRAASAPHACRGRSAPSGLQRRASASAASPGRRRCGSSPGSSAARRARASSSRTSRLLDEPFAVEVLRVDRAGRGEDVGRRAAADLERELVRAARTGSGRRRDAAGRPR